MLVALICLWVGFAIGFVTAAVLWVGNRDEGRLPAATPTRTTFEVSHVRAGATKAASRNATAHAETVN